MAFKWILLYIIVAIVFFQVSVCDSPAEAANRRLARAIKTNSKAAIIGWFPYVVHLDIDIIHESPCKEDGYKCTCTFEYRTHCTGVIVTQYWVVSVANCFNRYPDYPLSDVVTTVRAGVVNLGSKTIYEQERTSGPPILMDKVPGSKVTDWLNNSPAILKVFQPFLFTPTVGPITLGRRAQPEGWVKCSQVGFGQTGDWYWQMENELLYHTYGIMLPVAECRARLGVNYADDIVCVGPVAKRNFVCPRDSGGPLVCGLEGEYLLVGLFINTVGGGEVCGSSSNYNHFPYTNLGYHETWLREHIPDLPPSEMVSPMTGSQARREETSGARTQPHETGGGDCSHHVGYTWAWLVLATCTLL